MKVEVILLWWLSTFDFDPRLAFNLPHFQFQLLAINELHLFVFKLLRTLFQWLAFNRFKLLILGDELLCPSRQPRHP